LYYYNSNFAKLAQIWPLIWNARTRGLTPAKAQSTPSFGTERLIILQTILFIFSDLCGLGVFAGDIPSFGCGFAALGSLRSNISFSFENFYLPAALSGS
jgi:hypothetical protein